jgi:hypothetical protein
MSRGTHVTVDYACIDGRSVTHFHDVQLAARGPADLRKIITQRPESGP